jgi:hypothetical protein
MEDFPWCLHTGQNDFVSMIRPHLEGLVLSTRIIGMRVRISILHCHATSVQRMFHNHIRSTDILLILSNRQCQHHPINECYIASHEVNEEKPDSFNAHKSTSLEAPDSTLD